MSINSTEWAWKDMSVALNGVNLVKITRCTNKTARETEFLHGAGDDPFDINAGNKTYEGEVELYSTVVAKMNDAARAAGYDDLTDLPWQLLLKFKATKDTPMKIINIPNVRFNEFEFGGSNNDKSMKKVLTYKSLKPKYI